MKLGEVVQGPTGSLIKSQARTEHENLEAGNKENLDRLTSELNESAYNFSDYNELKLKKDEEFYQEHFEEAALSDEGSEVSVQEMVQDSQSSGNTSNNSKHPIRQDSSDIVQDQFESSDFYDDL